MHKVNGVMIWKNSYWAEAGYFSQTFGQNPSQYLLRGCSTETILRTHRIFSLLLDDDNDTKSVRDIVLKIVDLFCA